MAFQSHVLIGEFSESQAIADSESPTDGRDGFTFTGFDRVQLCTLLSLVQSGNSDTHFDQHLDSIDVLIATTGDWPVVSVVKSAQVQELAKVASLDETEFEQLAKLWEATEEFYGWQASDIRDLLRDVTDLADTAAQQGRCIMIWQSP